MGLPEQTHAGAGTSVRPAWTAGPAGWLTLMNTHQLMALLTELSRVVRGDQVDAGDDAYDVCQLIRDEVWQREWSTD